MHERALNDSFPAKAQEVDRRQAIVTRMLTRETVSAGPVLLINLRARHTIRRVRVGVLVSVGVHL